MSSHVKKRHSLPPAVVQAKTSGASKNHCPSAEYRRRGALNKVGSTKCPEPVTAGLPTAGNQPTEVAAVDLLSLYPVDEERVSLQDETICGDVGATQDLSDISTIELDDAEAEDILDKFARVYDEALPEQQQPDATIQDTSSSDSLTNSSFTAERVEHEDVSTAPTTSTVSAEDGRGSPADSNYTADSTPSEPQPETPTNKNGADGNLPQVLVLGINISLVRTTKTHPDDRVEEQRVASIGYTNSVNPRDINLQALFNCIQGEFVQYMNGNYSQL